MFKYGSKPIGQAVNKLLNRSNDLSPWAPCKAAMQ